MRNYSILMLLVLSLVLVAAENVQADQTYTLTVTSNPMLQGACSFMRLTGFRNQLIPR